MDTLLALGRLLCKSLLSVEAYVTVWISFAAWLPRGVAMHCDMQLLKLSFGG